MFEIRITLFNVNKIVKTRCENIDLYTINCIPKIKRIIALRIR